MVNYWKEKVLPKIKKVFDRNGKKAAAAEATKFFDESKEEVTKEFDEKNDDLKPKVLEIYEAASVEIKTLVKKPTNSGLKKNSAAVITFFEELVKIDFPGSKPVSEAATKVGPALIPGPIGFIFEKITTFIPIEEPPAPAEPEAAAEVVESTTKEVTLEEIKKEEIEKVEETPPPPPPADETPAPAPTKTAHEPEPEKPAEPAPPAPEPAKA